MNRSNNIAARYANMALSSYKVAVGDEEALDHQQWLEGLMADIRHLCDAHGWDHGQMQKAAHRLYQQDLGDDKPADGSFNDD